TSDGRVGAFGSNASGQLGLGSMSPSQSCTPLFAASGLISGSEIAIAAGDDHSLALNESDHVFGWGMNLSSEVGLPPSAAVSTPTDDTHLSQMCIVEIAAGAHHSLARR